MNNDSQVSHLDPTPLDSTPLDRIVGHQAAIALLTRSLACDHIAPAYLFVGAEGIGRSLVARWFAAQLLAAGATAPPPHLAKRLAQGNHPDVLWVEPTYLDRGNLIPARQAREAGLSKKTPPQIRLDQVRQIARFLSRPPLESDRAIVVIEAAETMQEGAANALLKTLEEPGAATLILLAPSVESLLSTIVSRCARINFHRLSTAEVVQVLHQVGREELAHREDLAVLAQGSPGEAIAQADRLQEIPEDLLAALKQLPRSRQAALELAQQVASRLEIEGQLWLVGYLQHWFWEPVSAGQTAAGGSGFRHGREACLRRLETLRQHLSGFVQPRLAWEVALLDLAVF